MHWRNESGWHKWDERIIDGETYTFTHLRSFDMTLHRPAKGEMAAFSAEIRVVFDCHVTTEDCAAYIVGDSRYWKDTGGQPRVFDLQRYKYSHSLPAMMEGLAKGDVRCYVAQHNNYMVWRAADADPSDTRHYQAYFDVYRPTNQADGADRLVLYVQSAFVRDNPHTDQREVVKPFVQLCAELYGVVPKKAKGKGNKKSREKKEARAAKRKAQQEQQVQEQ